MERRIVIVSPNMTDQDTVEILNERFLSKTIKQITHTLLLNK